jgi:hypothetical protein
MTSRDRYLEAQEELKSVRHALANQHISSERRATLQDHEIALSDLLTRPWFPPGRGKRWVMILIFAFGFQQALVGHYEGVLWWLLLPLLSPRLSARTSRRVTS